MLAPKVIAVIGASRKPNKLGTAMMASVEGFPGTLLPVSPGDETMFDSVAQAAESAGSVDLALLCVPAAACPQVLRECAAAGVAGAVICAGGFAEVDAAGAALQAEIDAIVAETGIRLLGPNTSGFFVPGDGVLASFVPGVTHLGHGAVGVVAASGGVNHAVSFQLDRVGAGVSVGVGLGAAADVGAAELVEYLAGHEQTRVIALHLESVADGPALLAAVRSAAAVKPVVALVVGRSSTVVEFAKSHTGALATSWATTRALLRQAGAVVVGNETELVNAASALSGRRAEPAPSTPSALVTGQAGPGLIIADELAARGVDLTPLAATTRARLRELLPPLTYLDNPIDTGRPGPQYPDVLRAVAGDENVTAIGIYGITEPVVALTEAVTASGAADHLPVLIAVDGPQAEVEQARTGASQDVPVLVGPSALAQGLWALQEDARVRPTGATDERIRSDGKTPAGPVRPGAWDEAEAKDLLASLGVSVPAHVVGSSDAEAAAALSELRSPVAAKLLDANVLHKSEIGGVVLGITDQPSLTAAVAKLREAGAKRFLLEEMAPSGVDLLLGIRRDVVFGPVAALALGGIEAEVYADSAICGLPASKAVLEAMPGQLAAAELLTGFRGLPALDTSELADVITNLFGLLERSPNIAEIEINPLRVTAQGLIALDAVIIEVKEDTR
ncbi:MAG: acetate--CoA ligase family protein [Pseudoclavibacter sp.]